MPPTTRFAPSPTGHLHIGGARTALFCWAFARREKGAFLLRIEDTDQARSSEESARGIMADLAWLGIDWDLGPVYTDEHGRTCGGDRTKVGPFFQAQRVALYDKFIDRLIESERAYHAFDTPAELDAERKAATATGKAYRYDRTKAMSIPLAERKRRAASGEAHVVRLATPNEPVAFTDEVLGDVSVAAGEVEDFVIRKGDGFPTYHFAVVVDDETMGVTHVVRAQEHLANTPKHIALQKALGFRTPKYGHLPLVFNEAGAKLSKRDKDKAAREAAKKAGLTSPPPDAGIGAATFDAWLKDNRTQLETTQLERLAAHLKLELPEINVYDFRVNGYLPEVICNYISLLGWSPPADAGKDVEKFDRDFLAKWFDLGRVGKTPARFDRKKLLAFNTDAIAAMSDADFLARWREWCAMNEPALPAALGDARFATMAAAVRPRSKTLKDAANQARFALLAHDAIEFDAKAAEKHLAAGDRTGLAVLKSLRAALAALPSWDAPALHAAVEQFAAESSLGMGKVAQPLRVALTGDAVSPPIDATLAVLGREGVLTRIDRCLARFGA